jgi:hypothetical protein
VADPDAVVDGDNPKQYCRTKKDTYGDAYTVTRTYSTKDDGSCDSSVDCEGTASYEYSHSVTTNDSNGVMVSKCDTYFLHTTTYETDPTNSFCNLVEYYSGSHTYTRSEEVWITDPVTFQQAHHTEWHTCAHTLGANGIWSACTGDKCTGFLYNSAYTHGTCARSSIDDPEPNVTETHGTPITTEYSDCSSDLCDPTELFEAFPDWGSSGVHIASSHFNGTSSQAVSASASQYRVMHGPSMTCYLKVWLRKTTKVVYAYSEPPVPDDITHDDEFGSYEWVGTGNPCVPDPESSVTGESNIIRGDVRSLDPPTSDGNHTTITVEILKYSFLQDYEPDITDEENPQPNGFPDPTWEAAAP